MSLMHIPFINPRRIALCCCLLLASLMCSRAQNAMLRHASGNPQDSAAAPLMFHFPISRAGVDHTFGDNHRTLLRLDSILADSTLCGRIDSLHIYAFASPDGNRDFNLRLAQRRSLAVRGFLLRRYPLLYANRVHPRPQGENWQELRRLIAADTHLPCREEVLQIIDHVPDGEHCKALLRKLDGGVPFRYISRHLLPELRNAAVCVVYLKAPLPALTISEADSVSTLLLRKGEILPKAGGNYPYPQWEICPILPRSMRKPLFAVKTNLLFDLAMIPNVEVEIPIGRRWSVNGEWMFPWWLLEGDKYCFQVLSGGLEGRYWLGNRNRHRLLTGHFVGFYAGGGKYDLQWDRDGYQGEFYIASGISYGYALPIGRHLNLEFCLGIGMLKTSYEYYHTRDNYQTLLWQNNGRYTWLGPTKAKISLVWMLTRKVKRGGVK